MATTGVVLSPESQDEARISVQDGNVITSKALAGTAPGTIVAIYQPRKVGEAEEVYIARECYKPGYAAPRLIAAFISDLHEICSGVLDLVPSQRGYDGLIRTITKDVHELCDSLRAFDCQRLGKIDLDVIRTIVSGYAIMAEKTRRTRFDDKLFAILNGIVAYQYGPKAFYQLLDDAELSGTWEYMPDDPLTRGIYHRVRGRTPLED